MAATAGTVEKDPASGEPTGILRGAATKLLKAAADEKPVSEADRIEQLKALFDDYNSVGITSIADRNADSDSIARYLKLRDNDHLTVRIAVSHAVSPLEKIVDTQARIREVAKHPLCQGDERLAHRRHKNVSRRRHADRQRLRAEPWGISPIYSISDPHYRGMLFIEKEDSARVRADRRRQANCNSPPIRSATAQFIIWSMSTTRSISRYQFVPLGRVSPIAIS